MPRKLLPRLEIKELRLGHLVLKSNVLMAPLAGLTCYPFRMLCYSLGAGLCFTEMVSSNGLRYEDKSTQRLLYTTKEEPVKAAQLLGADPRVMGQTALSERLFGFDIIDINMGCPVPQVFKMGEGSALLNDLRIAESIIRSCKKSGKIITVKTRVGVHEKSMNAAEFARMCEGAGAEMLTVHGRSRNMMYDGAPHFDQIEQAKSVVRIPVIANGGIFSVEDAERMMDRTGADGVMIARFGIENPFIFSELTGRAVTKSKYQVLLDQIDLAAAHYDESYTMAYIKKLASYFMKKLMGTKTLKQSLHTAGNLSELRDVVRKIFDRKGAN